MGGGAVGGGRCRVFGPCELRRRSAPQFDRRLDRCFASFAQVGHNSFVEAHELAAHAQFVGTGAMAATPPACSRPVGPDGLVEVMASVATGRAEQRQAAAIVGRVVRRRSIHSLKAAMAFSGLPVGPNRAPLARAGAAELASLRAGLEAAGYLQAFARGAPLAG